MTFEVFTRGRSATAPRIPGIRIATKTLTLNAAAARLIGSPRLVELLIDRVSRKIAIRPTSSALEFKVSASNLISAASFIRAYHLPAGFYPVQLVDGMIVADLSKVANA